MESSKQFQYICKTIYLIKNIKQNMSQVLVLKKTFIERIREDQGLQFQIANADPTDKVKLSTIVRWLKDNDTLLTTASRLEVLRKHFDVIETKELLERKTIEEVAS